MDGPFVNLKWKSDHSKSFNYTGILIRVIQSSTCSSLSWSLHALIPFRCLFGCFFLSFLRADHFSLLVFFCWKEFVQTPKPWQTNGAWTKVNPGRLIFLFQRKMLLMNRPCAAFVKESVYPSTYLCEFVVILSFLFKGRCFLLKTAMQGSHSCSDCTAGYTNHQGGKRLSTVSLKHQLRTEVQKNSRR